MNEWVNESQDVLLFTLELEESPSYAKKMKVFGFFGDSCRQNLAN